MSDMAGKINDDENTGVGKKKFKNLIEKA